MNLIVLLLTFLLYFEGGSSIAAPLLFPSSANLSTCWDTILSHNISFDDQSVFMPILLQQSPLPRPEHSPYAPSFSFGFYGANQSEKTYLLAIALVPTAGDARVVSRGVPEIVWSANRDKPVRGSAALHLTEAGDLLLWSADGIVWSTGTAGKSAFRLHLTERGNLALLDAMENVVWQSFDYPSATLLSGQILKEGHKLSSNTSHYGFGGASIFGGRMEGGFYVSYSAGGFGAYIDSDPPQIYYRFGSMDRNIEIDSRYYPSFLYLKGKTLTFVANSSDLNFSNASSGIPPASTVQFLRLEMDGHMKLYEWSLSTSRWNSTGEVIKPDHGVCGFPNVCGSFGICYSSGECRCPESGSLKMLEDGGCYMDLSCLKKNPEFVTAEGVSYFNYIDDVLLYRNSTTVDSCKAACWENHCIVALFRNGSCYLLRDTFSFIEERHFPSLKSTAYIRIQHSCGGGPYDAILYCLSLILIYGALVRSAMIVIFFILVGLVYWRKKARGGENEDVPELPGMPMRFSYRYLRAATSKFTRKLGAGGFGSVFEGRLGNGTRVAVKLLASVQQGKREFLSEVVTIGSIHHLNLVRLIGFCVEKSHRLLVYEHMSNGSLDKWIFGSNTDQQQNKLGWEICCKIIHDVARGLLYLHEECRQKIAHLDIKPQNILLDSDFNAKISDFGLAKLIDRDQSSVVTMMKGTPGYLAPEWLTSLITEKVDVYSFGVVIAEIVCRRKNLDYSHPSEDVHLLSLLGEKAKMGRLSDVLVACGIDVQSHGSEMEKMLKLSTWCLQKDVNKRPSMSMVVKVLEGSMEIREDLDYDFILSMQTSEIEQNLVANPYGGSTPLLASVLSGPR